MNKRAWIVLLLGLGVGLSGCSSEDSTTKPTENPPVEEPPTDDPPTDDPPTDDPADPPVRAECRPTSGGPHEILEGESFSAIVRCATGEELPEDLVVEGLPAGARYDAATNTLSWTPGFDQAAVYEIVLRVPDTTDSTTERIGVVDRWEAPENVPVADFLSYPEEYGLPVLHLAVDFGQLSATEFSPATITYGGRTWSAEVQYRGKSWAKRSFNVRFGADELFSDPSRGFTDARSIALISNFDDNSHVRNRLAFELWRRLDEEHLYIRSYHAVVYLNGQYHGLYLVTDQADGGLLARFGLREDGNLYVAVDHDANFSALDRYGLPKDSLSMGYQKVAGVPLGDEPGAYDDLEELIDFVANSTDVDFRAQFSEIARRRDYENWWLLVMFTLAGDSDEKNSVHYHDPEGGQWRVLLQDSNWSFGQTWQTLREPAETTRISSHNLLFKRLLDDPNVAIRSRLKEELRKTFDLQQVLALADEYLAEVKRSALRDEMKWGSEYASYFTTSAARTDILDHEGEAAYLRTWIEARWNHLDGRF